MLQIVIPSNSHDLVSTCLDSIQDKDPGYIRRVHVVTDDDDLVEFVEAAYPGASGIWRRPGPFTFAGAVNDAIEYAIDGEDVLVLNDDTELVTYGGLQNMENLLDKVRTRVGIVSCGIKGTAGVPDQQAGAGPLFRLAGSVSFTAVAITNEALKVVGALDEQFNQYGWEDNDYCTRAAAVGLGIGVFDGCVFRHERPHSTFSKHVDIKAGHLRGELIYRRKHTEIIGEPVFVVGPGSSGASVVAAAVNGLEIAMSDPNPPHIRSTSAHFRDTDLSSLVRHGVDGAELYALRRSTAGKPWGVRIWPNPQGLGLILEAIPDARIIFVTRDRDDAIASCTLRNFMSNAAAKERVDDEMEGLARCIEMAEESGATYTTCSFSDLIDSPRQVVGELAKWLGHRSSITQAIEVIHPEMVTFRHGLAEKVAPDDFGTVAIGLRCSNPQPSFVGCYALLIRNGLRDGDVLLQPQYRSPSHIAANNLMREFLATEADTLLLIDDDMTFDDGLLERLRSQPDNWRHGVVSALATQRQVPPRAIVMRESEQPPLPDAADGVYYSLVVDEITGDKTMNVDATGFAFTLIRRSVIEKMTTENGPRHTHYVQWGEGGIGEDVFFCRRAGSLGFTVAVDTRAQVGHLGSVVYGYDEFDHWRKQKPQSGAGLGADDLAELVSHSLTTDMDGEMVEKALSLLSTIRGIR